jgi:succinoglycan biosynthesis transport protein ExoP
VPTGARPIDEWSTVTDHLAVGLSVPRAIWRRKWVALVVLIAVLAAVVGWMRSAPRSYTASTTISASPSRALISSTGNFLTLETTLAQLASSQSVLQAVIIRLPAKRTVAQLRNEVHGALVVGTALIRITVTDAEPQSAARIANLVAEVLPRHDPSRGEFTFSQPDPAQVPTSYSAPNEKIIVLAGAALAVLLALGAALGYNRLAGTVDQVDQIRAITGHGVFGVLTRPSGRGHLLAHGASPSAAAVRSVRIGLDAATRAEPAGPIVVAAVARDSGVSGWVGCEIATTLAKAHDRVLLMDGNVARPTDHVVFAGRDSPGLCGVLREEARIDEALRAGPVGGLTLLPAGDARPMPAISFTEARFQKVLAEVGSRFEPVIILAPSLATSEDAWALAADAAVLLVVPARRIRIDTLRRCARDLEAGQVRVLGSVFVEPSHGFGAVARRIRASLPRRLNA